VIVVVGSPLVCTTDTGLRAAGMAAGIARAAAAAGAEVQVVGKVGEDSSGDAILLDLAAGLVGHVAILRDPSRATPAIAPTLEDEPLFDEDESTMAEDGGSIPHADGLSLEPADIELALRYLPDYRVLVIAEPLTEASLRVATAAAAWNGAALVVIVSGGAAPPKPDDDATVIEAPPDDSDDAFAGIVGAYAAAIDRGEEPKEAFASASSTLGWSAVAD
jgi:sugar/nucleoside kinase (ribokinase family)